MKQTKPFPFSAYVAAGCQTLTRDGKADLIGAGIHAVTSGMPCNGCFLDMSRCEAYAKLQADNNSQAAPVNHSSRETVRQEASRRGLSISEVRRQRAQEGGR